MLNYIEFWLAKAAAEVLLFLGTVAALFIVIAVIAIKQAITRKGHD